MDLNTPVVQLSLAQSYLGARVSGLGTRVMAVEMSWYLIRGNMRNDLNFYKRIYSPRLTKSVVLTFKFCSTKSLVLTCNEIYLIKVISSTKKALHRITHRANQIFSRYYLSSSNAYALIDDPKKQINNTIFNHNWQK